MSIDTFDVAADPHPYYAALRSEDPVYWDDTSQVRPLTRYDDVHAALRDARYSSRWIDTLAAEFRVDAREELQPLLRHLSYRLLTSDPPHHARCRAPAQKSSTSGVVEGVQGRIEQIVDELLDPVIETPLRRAPGPELGVEWEDLEWIEDPTLHGVTPLPVTF